VYVDAEWRKHKIATKLMAKVLDLARKLVLERGKRGDVGSCVVFVDEDNPVAKRFYEKSGFIEERKEQYLTMDGKEKTAVALQLQLTSIY